MVIGAFIFTVLVDVSTLFCALTLVKVLVSAFGGEVSCGCVAAGLPHQSSNDAEDHVPSGFISVQVHTTSK